MRIFRCERCDGIVPFTAQQCRDCAAPLGYSSEDRSIRVLVTTPDPATYRVGGHAQLMWRCLNTAWGCNWLVATTDGTGWCRSCALTRGRPDDARPQAIEAWMAAEAAKRRLVHQLDELALPVEIRSPTAPHGLVFDLVHLDDGGVVTGHLDGVITLDLAEADDQHREVQRCQLGEPYRTVIGHLRHEIGHYYWGRLVGQTDHLGEFRRRFGDERADYAAALERHRSDGAATWDERRFVTPYAAAHPFEDWAETFAHYLHIVDALDTAIAHDLVVADRARSVRELVADHDMGELLEAWAPVNSAVNAIAETLGAPTVYPFEPVGEVVRKLEFVHRQIGAHTARDRFYAPANATT